MSSFSNYGSSKYWDERYESDSCTPFEWYQTYDSLQQFLHPNVLSPSKNPAKESSVEFPTKSQSKVLIVGCGSSRFGEQMMQDGWIGGITNVDNSQVCIDQAKKRNNNDGMYRKIQAKLNRETREANAKIQEDSRDETPSLHNSDNTAKQQRFTTPSVSKGSGKRSSDSNLCIPKMVYECADVTKSFPYPDSSFDLIINKGAMDSILCSNGAMMNTKKMMKECSRLLKDHGSMIVVSHGKPDDRLLYFENEEQWWNGGVRVYKVEKPNIGALVAASGSKFHFIYLASK
eukprot:scaffold1338_cov272-Chaetoceros_neogracile.AAC.24